MSELIDRLRYRAAARDDDLATDAAARIEQLEAALTNAAANLAAAISLLEQTPKAKQAAPSNKMFDIMLSDYKKALTDARTAFAPEQDK